MSGVTLSFISVSSIHWYIDSSYRVLLLNNLYIAYICWTIFILHILFMFFFSNSIIWSSIDLYQIGYFDKGSSDILSLSNVEISPLSTDFVTCISFGLTWLSFRLFKTFCNLQMVIRFSIIWLRYFRFSSSSNGPFIVNSFFLLPWRFDIKCSILSLFVWTSFRKIQISFKRKSFIAIDC